MSNSDFNSWALVQKSTQLVFEIHLILIKCEQVQCWGYSTLVVHVSLCVKMYLHSSHMLLTLTEPYTTELSSISRAAKAYAHLLQPYKRASCRGLRVRSTRYRSYVYIYVIVSFCSWEERPSDSASVVLLTALTNVCLPVLILVGPSWRPSWSPWCNWSLRCDCVPSLMNVRWNSSCRRIQIHILCM